uniref:Uncharacterized protein n=1 Tax=Glossina palpalis gambiensis TaxID=67801 RepID=A0A1B0B7R4_9MUSC
MKFCQNLKTKALMDILLLRLVISASHNILINEQQNVTITAKNLEKNISSFDKLLLLFHTYPVTVAFVIVPRQEQHVHCSCGWKYMIQPSGKTIVGIAVYFFMRACQTILSPNVNSDGDLKIKLHEILYQSYTMISDLTYSKPKTRRNSLHLVLKRERTAQLGFANNSAHIVIGHNVGLQREEILSAAQFRSRGVTFCTFGEKGKLKLATKCDTYGGLYM